MLCDTFDGPINGAVWTAVGDVTVDSSVAHRGTSSLRMHIPATAQGLEVGSYIDHTGSMIANALTPIRCMNAIDVQIHAANSPSTALAMIQ